MQLIVCGALTSLYFYLYVPPCPSQVLGKHIATHEKVSPSKHFPNQAILRQLINEVGK